MPKKKSTASKPEAEKTRTRKNPKASAAPIGYEAKLWQMADALRNNMDAAEYKHVVLGLIFLKYISDAFEVKHAELEANKKQGADPEDPDEYRAASIFWVPPEARWQYLKSMAPQPAIGQLVDDAMTAIERDNCSTASTGAAGPLVHRRIACLFCPRPRSTSCHKRMEKNASSVRSPSYPRPLHWRCLTRRRLKSATT